MTPRRSARTSKDGSPTKRPEASQQNEGAASGAMGPSKGPVAVPSIKLRFNAAGAAGGPAPEAPSGGAGGAAPLVPKLKLRLSSSGSSVSSTGTPSVVPGATDAVRPKGKRGRPSKAEGASEGRRLRQSQSLDAVPGPRRRRGRRPLRAVLDAYGRTEEHVTIDEDSGHVQRKRHVRLPLEHVAPGPLAAPQLDLQASRNASVSAQENDLVLRTKSALNIAAQHDCFLYHTAVASPLQGPFRTLAEAVETLAAFHVAAGSGYYDERAVVDGHVARDHGAAYAGLVERFRESVHAVAAKKVPSELLLLEQKLCLEEEKFLLIKLKQEYFARFSSSSHGSASSLASRSTSHVASPAPLMSRSLSLSSVSSGSASGPASSYDSLPR